MLDLIAQVESAPGPGETVLGQRLDTHPGGRGFNQAIAAVRLGCAVELVPRVGNDEPRSLFLETLDRDGIGRAHVSVDADHGTGTSLIVATPGANLALTPAHVAEASASLASPGALLLSFEVPLDALNAASAQPIPDDLAVRLDVLIVNEIEASALTGAAVESIDAALRAADRLRALVRRAAVVTLGEQGAVFTAAGASGHLPAFETDVRDTTGAGDAFCSALAFALATGYAIQNAVGLANAAGSLATRTPGAAPAMPTADAVLTLAGAP